MRVCTENCDAALLYLFGEGFELRSCGDEYEVGLERDDALDVRLKRVTDFCYVLRFRRGIAECRVAHQTTPRTDCVNNLRQVRRKRDDALRADRRAHAPPSFVRHLACLYSIIRWCVFTGRRTGECEGQSA